MAFGSPLRRKAPATRAAATPPTATVSALQEEAEVELAERREEQGEAPPGTPPLAALRQFEFLDECAAGRLRVTPLSGADMAEVEELLTGSFSDLMGPFTFLPLLRLQVQTYLAQRLLLLPHGVTLVAALDAPADGAGAPPRVAATVELSLSPSSRPRFASLNPPPGCVYLCNMAVLPSLRRRGVGKALLRAAEALARTVHRDEIFLHCRVIDDAPRRLYEGAGYRAVAGDSHLSAFLGLQRRRVLMSKRLPDGP